MLVAIGLGALDAEDEERGRQGVGLGGGRRGYCGEPQPLGRPAGARIEDVPELAALVHEMLISRRRGAEAAVVQTQHGEAFRRIVRIEQTNRPAMPRTGLASQGQDAAVTAVNEHVLHAPLAMQQPHDLVERIALADAAEVDFDSGSGKGNTAALRVELNILHATAVKSCGALLVRRDTALSPVEAPGLDQSADRGIEGPLGLLVQMRSAP